MVFAGIIAGLGNPGKEYQNHRHNIGFRVIDKLCEAYGEEKLTRCKLAALTAKARIIGKIWLLMKPQSYMNLCGGPMAQIAQFYKIEAANLWVIHDEIDLPIGKIRTKFGGGSAGHNGLKSITQHMGANYHRLRIGIGRPTCDSSESAVSHYVLGDFSNSEAASMATFTTAISEHIGDMLDGRDADFINKIYHQTPPT